MGNVVNGKYAVAPNGWMWNLERNAVLDFVPWAVDETTLAIIPRPPEFDPVLYFRPFTKTAWYAVVVISFGGLVFYFAPYYFIKGRYTHEMFNIFLH